MERKQYRPRPGETLASSSTDLKLLRYNKKGDRKKAENYRGITLMDTGYKVMAMILEERLRKETERLGIIPETQAGFRKKRSGIDNIYILKTAAE